MKYLLLLLLSFTATAQEFTHIVPYFYPVEREGGLALGFKEIRYIDVIEVECGVQPLHMLKKIKQVDLHALFPIPAIRAQDKVGWIDLKPITCVVLTATDTDGRESVWSDVFVVSDFNAPVPIECQL